MNKQILLAIAQQLGIVAVAKNELASLFEQLAEGVHEHTEMTGREYIDQIDNPATGCQVAAETFNKVSPAEQVFAPTFIMLPLAGDFSREQYHEAGWTDDALIESCMMEMSGPKPAPSTADVAPSPTAPVAPPSISTPPAPALAPPAPNSASASADAVAAPSNPAFLDKSGLPWDARIHSGGRTMTKDEMWVKKKGVTPALLAQVTSELLQAQAAKVPFVPLSAIAPAPAAPAPVAPPAAAAPQPPAPAPQAPAPGGVNPQAATAVSAALAAARQDNADARAMEPTDFAQFCKWIGAHGKDMTYVLPFVQKYGMTGVGMLARPEYAPLIGTICTEIRAALQ